MIFQVGKTRQLVVWHSESVNGLDPETGKVYWTVPFDVKASMSIPTPRLAGDLLLVTGFYSGAMLIKLDPDDPSAAKPVGIAVDGKPGSVAMPGQTS